MSPAGKLGSHSKARGFHTPGPIVEKCHFLGWDLRDSTPFRSDSELGGHWQRANPLDPLKLVRPRAPGLGQVPGNWPHWHARHRRAHSLALLKGPVTDQHKQWLPDEESYLAATRSLKVPPTKKRSVRGRFPAQT